MFKFIESEDLEKNVTNDYINELEKKMKIVFPSILREYYLKHNFSKEKECTFRIEGIDADFILDTIIPLKYGTISLEKEYKWVLENEYISNEHIPLAVDMDADNYYWNSNTGKVYYISHENVENPILVCNSVEDFFEILNKSADQTITIPNLNITKKRTSNSRQNNRKKKEPQSNIIFYAAIIFFIVIIIYCVVGWNKEEKESNVVDTNSSSTETVKQKSEEVDDRFNKIFSTN